ncbi:DUF1993 domain-containing protein [Chelatococcus reniformis]|nr:DUF1993 domain-containing protein [Chelatococcus reniformis]
MSSMYELSVPVLIRGLGVLSHYMVRAAAFAETRGIDPAELADARLAADMLPLTGQIQRASDTAKNGVARLTGTQAPSFADTETTLAELKERLDKTIAYLETLTPEQFAGADERSIALPFRNVSAAMPGRAYLTQFMLPNFFFHVATAHGILRQRGLDIGKTDYLGGF